MLKIQYWCQKNLPGLLSTPPEKYGKKIVKHNFGMKNKIGRFFLGHPVDQQDVNQPIESFLDIMKH